MGKTRKEVIASNAISELASYSLGGFEQKVLIEGRSPLNPLVIILHGGPGFPLPMGVGGRGLWPDFTDTFTMVYWDQLGCGINNHPIDDSFSIDSYVDMTIDLAKTVRKDYPNRSVNLFAVSWGTILSAKVAAKAPELIDNVVASGQVVRDLSTSKEVFEALMQSDMPPKLKARLEEICSKCWL